MSDEPQAPIPGAGLRHAMLFAVIALLPLTYAVTDAAAEGIEGFSPWLAIVVTLGIAVAAALVSVAFPMPSFKQVLARIAIIALVAMAVRFTVPSPGLAWEQVRADEAPLVSGTALLMFALLAIAFATGHAFAHFVAHLATPAPTTEIARYRERRALVVWWWAAALQVFVLGVTRDTATTTAGVLLVVCAVLGLALLADLRLRTPLPATKRPPIVAAPRRVRTAGVVFGLVSVVALTALLTPLVPVERLRTVPSVPTDWFDWDFAGRGGDQLQDAMDDQPGDLADEVEDPPPAMPSPDWEFPTIPWQVLAALAAIALTMLLRPHRWKAGLRKLASLLRLSRLLPGADDAAGELTAFEDLDDDADDPSGRGRFRRAFDRIRPRPRDPRGAVLYDYFHVERLLAKQEQGREGWETPHEHAVRVHVSETHEQLADLAADARFARTPPDRDAVTRARELRRDIEQALRDAGR